MKIDLLFSITELSNLTGKTRPTLYKYINSYEEGKLDDIPYSFIQLFNLMVKENVRRKEIIEYCNLSFQQNDPDGKINELIMLIKQNKANLDIDKIKKIVEEEIKNGGSSK